MIGSSGRLLKPCRPSCALQVTMAISPAGHLCVSAQAACVPASTGSWRRNSWLTFCCLHPDVGRHPGPIFLPRNLRPSNVSADLALPKRRLRTSQSSTCGPCRAGGRSPGRLQRAPIASGPLQHRRCSVGPSASAVELAEGLSGSSTAQGLPEGGQASKQLRVTGR